MSVIEAVVPIVTADQMQAIWDANPNSTLTLLNGRRELITQPACIPSPYVVQLSYEAA